MKIEAGRSRLLLPDGSSSKRGSPRIFLCRIQVSIPEPPRIYLQVGRSIPEFIFMIQFHTRTQIPERVRELIISADLCVPESAGDGFIPVSWSFPGSICAELDSGFRDTSWELFGSGSHT